MKQKTTIILRHDQRHYDSIEACFASNDLERNRSIS